MKVAEEEAGGFAGDARMTEQGLIVVVRAEIL